MKQLRRDPFARVTYWRRTVLAHGKTCKECGYPGRMTSKGYTLYQYGAESDGVRPNISWDDNLFCSASCRKAYY